MAEAALHLLVGTTKGAFVVDGDADRSTWTVRGPYCDGWPVNHVIGDPATGTIWAGGGGTGPAPASGAPTTSATRGPSRG